MKSRETLIRLKQLQVDEKRGKVAQIESMIAEFECIAGDLEREIRTEQGRAGIHDTTHFAYPTYAKAAIQRRENLKNSADELKVQLNDAKDALAEAFEEKCAQANLNLKVCHCVVERTLEAIPAQEMVSLVVEYENNAMPEGATKWIKRALYACDR